MKRVVGFVLIVLGIVIILFSSEASGITGNVVSENVGKVSGSIIGLIFIILGLALSLAPSLEKTLSSEDRQEIKNAFRDWDGKVSKKQKGILKKYGLDYELTKGNHIAFYYPGNGRRIITSSTPSDRRSGMNLASNLIDYIQSYQN